ncbi:MAG TPA: dihydropyrimidinase [Conexivisphaerales archaeon]|nr:dihydropyrimidinase [Conexivisphaerales archaeon]
MPTLLVRNGIVATASEAFQADVKAVDGVITKIAASIDEPADKVVNAQGRIVVPGGIDGHTHFEMPSMGTTTADDFRTGTISAASGGITSIFDFVLPQKGESMLAALQKWQDKASPKVFVDYGFHMTYRDAGEEAFKEIKEVIAAGVTSFKVYTTYRNQGLMLDDGGILDVMKEVSSNGGLLAVHSENDGIIAHNIETFKREGKLSPEYHPLAKPPIAEGEAVQRMIAFARYTGGNVYVVHLSTKMGRESIRDAQRGGLPVFAETCPHYLVFNDLVYKRSDAPRFVMSPPLKSEEDRLALWEGIIEGDIKTIGSDHADFNSEQKALGKDDFTLIPNGVAGTEAIMPVLFTEGFAKKRISINRFVQVTSTNAAKAYNLFPKKGTIAVGSDADMVIIDPSYKARLTAGFLHANIDYSIYENYVTEGYPVMTISRGEVIVEENQLVASEGRGRFLPRKPYPNNRSPLFQ